MTIDLVKPGEVWGDRVNERNVRFAKVLRYGRTRTHVGIDVFNVLNSQTATEWNEGSQVTRQDRVTSPDFLNEVNYQQPRYVRFTARYEF